MSRTTAEQQAVYDGEQAQFQTAIDRGRVRYNLPDLDPYYRRAAGLVEGDQRWLSQHFVAAATPEARDEVLAEGARRAVVAYSTMGAGDAPDWLYSVGGIKRSLGVAPVPVVPVQRTPATGSTFNVNGSAALAPTLNVPGFGLVVFLLILAIATDDNREES